MIYAFKFNGKYIENILRFYSEFDFYFYSAFSHKLDDYICVKFLDYGGLDDV